MTTLWYKQDLTFSLLLGLTQIDSICLQIYKNTLHSLYKFYLHFDCHFPFSRVFFPCSLARIHFLSYVRVFVFVYSPFSLSFILCFVEKAETGNEPGNSCIWIELWSKTMNIKRKKDANKQHSKKNNIRTT